MIRILLIEDNKKLVKDMKNYFNNEIRVVLVANDGVEGIELIKMIKDYDIIVLDLIMPLKDGICVLDEISKLNIKKPIIISTSNNSEQTIKRTSIYNIIYYVLKPYELKDLEDKIINCINNKSENIKDISKKIIMCLHELGIPSNLKGYCFLKEGFSILLNNKCNINTLYSMIASKFNTNIPNVERSIRRSIEIGYNRGNINFIEEIFGYSISLEKSKPTNTEFIFTVFDYLSID